MCGIFDLRDLASGFEFFLTAQAEENSQREQTIYSSIILHERIQTRLCLTYLALSDGAECSNLHIHNS